MPSAEAFLTDAPSAEDFLTESTGSTRAPRVGSAAPAEPSPSAEAFLSDQPTPLTDADFARLSQPPSPQLPGGMNEPGTREEKLQEAGAILGAALSAPAAALDAILPHWTTAPLVHAPATSPEDLAFRQRHPIIGGIEGGIVNLAESFASPIGIATLGLGALPSTAQRAVSLAFAAQMASSAPQLADAIGQAWQMPDSPERTQTLSRLFTEAAGTAAFTTLAARHGLTPATLATPREQMAAMRRRAEWLDLSGRPEEAAAIRRELLNIRQAAPPPEAANPYLEASAPEVPSIPSSAAPEEQGTPGGQKIPTAPTEPEPVAAQPAPAPAQRAAGILPAEPNPFPAASQSDVGRSPEAEAAAQLPPSPRPTGRGQGEGSETEAQTRARFAREQREATAGLREIKGSTSASDVVSSAALETGSAAAAEPTRAGAYAPQVTDAHRAAARQILEAEAAARQAEPPPDIFTDLDSVTRGPIKFGLDQAQTILDAKDAAARAQFQTPYSKLRKPQRKTIDDALRMTTDTGMPADQALQALAQNPKYAAWTADDLAQAMGKRASGILPGGPSPSAVESLAAQIAEAERPQEKTEKTEARTPLTPLTPVESDPFALPGVTGHEPELIGLGGAIPGEFQRSAASNIGIKVAAMDAQRAARGEEPLTAIARRSFPEDTWPAALAEVENDPAAPERLVNELAKARDAGKPAALTARDIALLLYHQAELNYERARITREMAQAWEDARAFPDRLAQYESLKLESAKLQDRLDAADRAIQDARYEWGAAGRALQHMIADNFSLAAMEMQKRVSMESAGYTPEEQIRALAEVARLQKIIEEMTTKADTAEAQAAEERAKRQAAEAVNAAVDEITRSTGFNRHATLLAERFNNWLQERGSAAEKRFAEKMARLSAGVDPTLLVDLTEMAAAAIGRGVTDGAIWVKQMVQKAGPKIEHIRHLLVTAWNNAQTDIDRNSGRFASGKDVGAVRRIVKKEDVDGTRANLVHLLNKERVAKTPVSELGGLVRKLVENLVRSGLRDLDPITDRVHEILQENFDPAITRRQTTEIIGGYGDFRELSKDQIAVQIRDLRAQAQLTAKLLAVQASEPLKKSGPERAPVSDTQRRILQQLNEAKRRFGVVVTDPARQLKSALDAIHTRLRNQIKDLEFQLATKAKIVKQRTPTPYDQEATLLQARRDDLQRQFDEMFPRQPLTDAQRSAIAQRALERSIANYEERIKANDVLPASRRQSPNSPQLEALRARRDAVRAEWEGLRALDPQYQLSREAQALSQYKSRLLAQEASYRDRLARGDFSVLSASRRKIKLDPQALEYRARAEAAKREFQRGLIADRLKNRPWWAKAQETFVRWRRGFILSSPVTLAKLTSAAVQRLAITPIEEGLGALYSKALPGLAARAPREAGLNVQAEAKALTEGFMSGLKDSWDQLRTGESQMDLLYGRGREGAIGESDVLPRSAIDFFGHLHGALKAPVKRAEFARSFEKRAAFNMARGVDVSDPLVQSRIALEAYKDATRSIFLQDNMVVDAYKRGLSRFEERNKLTGKPTAGGKLAATVARTLLPIVRVPTNIVAETFQYALGVPSGLTRLGLAMRKGIETLPEDQADLIMRHLKKGSLGAAVMTAGFLLPNLVGGYYQPGQKRDKQDVKFGSVRIGDWDVPSYLLHNPLLETLQLGATVRRVADSKLRKSDTEPQGVPAGLLAGALGLTEEVPFVREMMEVSKAFEPHERGAFFGELGKGIAIPQLVQWLARQTDEAYPEPGRRATNAWQHVEMGIPGLRHNVPLKPIEDDAHTMAGELMKLVRPRKGEPPLPAADRQKLRLLIEEVARTNAAASPDYSNGLRQAAEAIRTRPEFNRTNSLQRALNP